MTKKTKAGVGAAAAGAILLSLGVIKPFEGRELTPYYDIVGVLTWCDGETKGTPKPRYTNGECDSILAKSTQRMNGWRCASNCRISQGCRYDFAG